MEFIQPMVNQINQTYQTADHLAYVTYPLVKDVRLIATVIDNLYHSLSGVMELILQYDREYKRIGPLPQDFRLRLEVFKKCMQRYNIDKDFLNLIDELRQIVIHRQKSPMEFVRNNKLVICNDGYKNMKTITIEKTKDYLTRARPFIQIINSVFVTKK